MDVLLPVARILGLAPYTDLVQFRTSCAWRVYSVVVLGICYVVEIHYFFFNVEISYFASSPLAVVKGLEALVYMGQLTVVNVVAVLRQQRGLVNFLRVAYRPRECVNVLLDVVEMAPFVLDKVFLIYSFFERRRGNVPGFELATLVCWLFNRFMLRVELLLMSRVLACARWRYEWINGKLVGGTLYVDGNVSSPRMSRGRRACWTDIRFLRKTHQVYTDDLEGVVNAMQAPVLVELLESYIIVLIYAFNLTTNVDFNFHSATAAILCASTLTSVLSVIINAQLVGWQGNRTAVLVHNFLNSDGLMESEKEELKLFSMQLMHRKVEITLLGLFSLDCKLITAAVGALTTYLVILVQFQLTSGTHTNSSCENSTGTPWPMTNTTEATA